MAIAQSRNTDPNFQENQSVFQAKCLLASLNCKWELTVRRIIETGPTRWAHLMSEPRINARKLESIFAELRRRKIAHVAGACVNFVGPPEEAAEEGLSGVPQRTSDDPIFFSNIE
jgi:hypothetical protein